MVPRGKGLFSFREPLKVQMQVRARRWSMRSQIAHGRGLRFPGTLRSMCVELLMID